MGMQIQTNVAAINAQRNLNVTGIKMGKVLEKLSSGYRINRAADDAAGLGISEKMRAQIRGNAQAIRNAQDGISMVQTAEGAMDEVHSILQRMRELAVQAANGTYGENGPERISIGQEINQLRQEIDRISVATQFNSQRLLDGSVGAPPIAQGAGDTLITGAAAGTLTVASVSVANAAPGTSFTLSYNAGTNDLELTDGTDTVTINVPDAAIAGPSTTFNFAALGVSVTLSGSTADGTATDTALTALAALSLSTDPAGPSVGANLHIGANSDDFMAVSFSRMHSDQLGIGAGQLLSDVITDDTNVSTIVQSRELIDIVDAALQNVSSQRGELGAIQNRLESVIKSLSITVENLSAAESRIRDADIAELSSQLVAQQILQQAGVSVLSQANTAPQAALSLLQ